MQSRNSMIDSLITNHMVMEVYLESMYSIIKERVCYESNQEDRVFKKFIEGMISSRDRYYSLMLKLENCHKSLKKSIRKKNRVSNKALNRLKNGDHTGIENKQGSKKCPKKMVFRKSGNRKKQDDLTPGFSYHREKIGAIIEEETTKH